MQESEVLIVFVEVVNNTEDEDENHVHKDGKSRPILEGQVY